jgi:hypothetical protein
MCGGCRRCLHDQGIHCGEVDCCGPLEPEPLTLRAKLDPADYSWEGEGGYSGHDNRLELSFWQGGIRLERTCYDLAQDGAVEEMLEFISDMIEADRRT